VQLGGVPMPMTPAQFGKLIADETEKWAKVVKFSVADPLYRRRITALSSQEIARYITDETIARIVIAVMTMFILKI
jgi:hypothetical protein